MRQMEEIGLIGFGINTATREKYVGGKLLVGWEERIQRRTPSSRAGSQSLMWKGKVEPFCALD